MSEIESQCLEVFPQWLAALPDDATALSSLLSAESIPEKARRHVAGALNYLFKSLDLIPDGVEDLGFLDDAFVLRVAATVVLREVPDAREADIRGVLARLAGEAPLIESLLEADYKRLEKYVLQLEKGAGRGRTVDEIVSDPAVRAQLIRDVQQWTKGYKTPSFSGGVNTLVKLKAFLGAKLP